MCYFSVFRYHNLHFSTPFLPLPYTWSNFAYFVISPIGRLPEGCRSRSLERGNHGHGRDGYTAVHEGIVVFFCSTFFSLKPVHNLKYHIILNESSGCAFSLSEKGCFCHSATPVRRFSSLETV